MKNTIFAAWLFACGFALGCGTSLTMEGAKVKVAPDADAIAQCQPISAVEAVGGNPEVAEIIIRNKAGTMAANTVFVGEKVEVNGNHLFVGKAYNCKSEGM